MAIINATPDSFSGDGQLNIDAVVAQAKQALTDGAHILDIGGESTRPDSQPITAEQEQQRVLPVIQAIKNALPEAIISIDTYRAETARKALQAGAGIINDIAGGKDPDMLKLAADQGCPIILMHNSAKRGQVQAYVTGNSYAAAEKVDFIGFLLKELKIIADNALNAGVAASHIILDPGIGFGKTVQQNLLIIKHLVQIKSLGYPVLIGASRKSFIGQILSTTVDNRLYGSLACAYAAAQNGADYLRVHDVLPTRHIVEMQTAFKNPDHHNG